MEGVPRTLCTNIIEAQLNPALCSTAEAQRCPPLPVDEITERVSYVSQFAEGVDCREVRVWDPGSQGFLAVKVCDVIPGVNR